MKNEAAQIRTGTIRSQTAYHGSSQPSRNWNWTKLDHSPM